MVKSMFVSAYNLSIDSYLGQYSSFYDFYFKPNIVFRRVSKQNWALYSLLQLKKKAKQFYVLEPFLSKREKSYKSIRQKNSFVSNLENVIQKSGSKRSWYKDPAIRNLEKFQKNISLLSFGFSEDIIKPIVSVKALNRFNRFIYRRKFKKHHRAYIFLNAAALNLYKRNKRLRARRLKLKLHDQSKFNRISYVGLDRYLLEDGGVNAKNKYLKIIKAYNFRRYADYGDSEQFNFFKGYSFRRFNIDYKGLKRLYHNISFNSKFFYKGHKKIVLNSMRRVKIGKKIRFFRFIDIEHKMKNENYGFMLNAKNSNFFSYYNYFYLSN